MTGAALTEQLARLAGVRLDEARVLADHLARDRRRRMDARARQSGLSADALDVVVALYLALAGVGCAGVALFLRAEPARAALLLYAILMLLALGLSFSELFAVLLADEGFRVVASWPVRSQSFLLARLREPARRLGQAMLLLAVPPALALAIGSGIPLVTGAVFLVVALAGAVAMLFIVAAIYSALVASLGARRARVIGSVLQLVGLVAPLGLGASVQHLPLARLDLAAAPRALPLTWMAALVQGAAGRLHAADAWMIAAALAWLLLAPLASFAWTARQYTRGLRTARLQRTRPPWTPPAGWVLALLRRSADRIVVTLLVAHARFDWRFRAQLLALPIGLVAVLSAYAGGLDVRQLFADPLHATGLWQPSMLFIVLALLQPALTLPLLSGSAEHGAAWVLRVGALPMDAFAVAGRRVVRVLFIAPMLLLTTLGYVWAGAPLPSIVVHVATMALLSEAVARLVAEAFPYPPFTRPTDDDERAKTMMATALLAYVTCGLTALAVVHIVYAVAAHWL